LIRGEAPAASAPTSPHAPRQRSPAADRVRRYKSTASARSPGRGRHVGNLTRVRRRGSARPVRSATGSKPVSALFGLKVKVELSGFPAHVCFNPQKVGWSQKPVDFLDHSYWSSERSGQLRAKRTPRRADQAARSRPDRITPISNAPLRRPLQPTVQRRPLGR
jgi:hypothetical protein